MGWGGADPKEFGYYVALGQVGVEMVVPIGLGVLLDRYLGWEPWATVVGAVIGLVGGFAHLMLVLKRHDSDQNTPPGRDSHP